MHRSLLAIVLAAATALFGMDPLLLAQDQPPPADEYPAQSYPQGQAYPQSGTNEQDAAADQQHGVARLSVVQGDVNVKLGSTGELVAGAVNAPLVAQDHVQTSDGSRAEIEFDYANSIRVAPNTDVGFADLEYRRYQVQLAAGTIVYRVLRQSDGQAEIDTPSIAIRPMQEGIYRISVRDDGTTEVTVRSGEAEIYSPSGSQYLQPGQTMLVQGDASNPQFQTIAEIPADQFDDWCGNRDRELLASQSYRYVSPDIYGADDLDAYGTWVPSQYGTVWQPQLPVADWSPYSYGHWAWIDYYGWSWVDYAPWGWAPFHYGRWFWNGPHGWCWWPGAVSAAFWSPAVVGFFGWGGFGLSFGLGGLGWVALAPFEVFHPWWGRGFYGGWRGGGWGRGYERGLERGVDVARMYRNARVRGGAMAAAYNGFGGVHQRYTPASQAQLRGANLFRGSVPLAPTRTSLQFSNHRATANPRLATAANRQFFVHQRPPQVGGARVAQQQTRMQQGFGGGSQRAGMNGQRGIAPNAQRPATAGPSRNTGVANGANSRMSQPLNARMNEPRLAAPPQRNAHGVPPNMRTGVGAQNSYRTPSSSGWQRFGDPGVGNAFRQGFTGANEHSGWHSFGAPEHSNAGPAYGAGRTGAYPASPGPARSFGSSPYRQNYPSRPQVTNRGASMYGGYSGMNNGGRSPFAAPHTAARPMQHFSAPAAPHYAQPAMPHYSAPSGGHSSAPAPRGGGSFHGGGSPHGGGGSHGGGGHPSSSGHHSR